MVIVLILLLGLGLRLVNLNQSLWLDEAVQAATSQMSLTGLFAELKGDFHPPLYHLFLWGWARVFGSGEISLRLPSVLFGVGAVWVVYKIRRLFTPGVSLASLLLAIAPFHIYYSQEARLYSLGVFLTCLSIYYFIRVLRGERGEGRTTTWECKVGYILATLALLYTDYYGFFILLAQNLVFLFLKHRSYIVSIRYKDWLKSQIIIAFMFLPWLPMFLTQIKMGRQAIASLPEWGRLVNLGFLKALPLTFVKFAIGRITIFNKRVYALVAGILFLVYGSIILKAVGKKKKRPRANYWYLTTVSLWLLVPIISAWLLSFWLPNYQPFRLLLSLPAFYLLLSLGIQRTKSPSSWLFGLLLVIVSLTSLGVYYFNPYFHREDWRGLVHWVESQEKVVALLPSQTSSWPWSYYSSGRSRLLPVSSGVRSVSKTDFESLKITSPKIIYVRYLVPLFDPEEKIEGWLKEAGFVKIREVSFNQIPVWEYAKKGAE